MAVSSPVGGEVIAGSTAGQSPEYSVVYWSQATFVRRIGETAAHGGRDSAPCSDFASYTLAFALSLRKIAKNLSQSYRIVVGF